LEEVEADGVVGVGDGVDDDDVVLSFGWDATQGLFDRVAFGLEVDRAVPRLDGLQDEIGLRGRLPSACRADERDVRARVNSADRNGA